MAEREVKIREMILCGIAAFATYFCVYAYRKPFAAGVFADQSFAGLHLKTALILSQLLGYTVSKFVGIKFVSEIKPQQRILAIVVLLALAQLALVVFAWGPAWCKVLALFGNGFPLGMTFGLIMSFLEGRRFTEALTAVLCASFIVSSGVVKSLGQWLIQDWQISEFAMPMVIGFVFMVPTLIAVYLLSLTPEPDRHDLQLRARRLPMTGTERWQFFQTYQLGLLLFLFVYICLTIVRTIRDDFAVEIWAELGVERTPSIYATAELYVCLIATSLAAVPVVIRGHLPALRITSAVIVIAFGVCVVLAWGQPRGWFSPLAFMVSSGAALYVPYVAFHTTMFERLVAAAQRPANLGFLMYLADSVGYLGYAALIVWKTGWSSSLSGANLMLDVFRWTLLGTGVLCSISILIAIVYFQSRLTQDAMPLPLPDEAKSSDI